MIWLYYRRVVATPLIWAVIRAMSSHLAQLADHAAVERTLVALLHIDRLLRATLE